MENFYPDFESRFSSIVEEFYCSKEPHPLKDVILYVLKSPGKRTRAKLCMATCESLGFDPWKAFIPAVAVEFVHAYSLVHDDLPCMDDDNMRRGRPTAHVKFGEAFALLAGDSIMTDATSLLIKKGKEQGICSDSLLKMIDVLSEDAGFNGIVCGQSLDLHWTGRLGYDEETLLRIHLLKTGKLIAAACALGAIAAGRTSHDIQRLHEFGMRLGLSYQIFDDYLDAFPATGKSLNKDKDQKKLTYRTFFDDEQILAKAKEASESAWSLLDPKENLLKELSKTFLKRTL